MPENQSQQQVRRQTTLLRGTYTALADTKKPPSEPGHGGVVLIPVWAREHVAKERGRNQMM